MLKDLQKMKRLENKDMATGDVTEDVFATPAEEKPMEIQMEAPEPDQDRKTRKPKPFKRRR